MEDERFNLFFPIMQVVISRLPVGHTHEDIDQKFSVISRVSAVRGRERLSCWQPSNPFC